MKKQGKQQSSEQRGKKPALDFSILLGESDEEDSESELESSRSARPPKLSRPTTLQQAFEKIGFFSEDGKNSVVQLFSPKEKKLWSQFSNDEEIDEDENQELQVEISDKLRSAMIRLCADEQSSEKDNNSNNQSSSNKSVAKNPHLIMASKQDSSVTSSASTANQNASEKAEKSKGMTKQ